MRRAASALLAALLAVGLLASGCTQSTPPPTTPTPTPTPTQRPFTVVTTEAPVTYDPAAATTSADAVVALNVFSRLMVVHPEGAELKPDLARDCLYTSPTEYVCDLPENLTFHNGHALTASDVQFSIARAYRLSVPRSSIQLFDSLQRVEVVDPLTVKFVLKWADSQFGYALATPAASIVDEEIYDPDAVRPDTGQAIGSGPYQLVTAATEQLVFERFETYVGALRGEIRTIRLSFLPDSAAAEKAMADRSTDVVWRSLNPAALTRLASEATAGGGRTKGGFALWKLADVRLQRLVFTPASAHRDNAAVRAAVAASLQPDRSVGSLVLPGVTGGVASFPVGGSPTVPPIQGQRLRLTLTYSSKAPGQRDLAGLVRDRLESAAGVSVLLVADASDADLLLTDRQPWLNTALGWLQPYVDEPLPGTEAKIQDLVRRARETTDAAARTALLAEIQQQAAADLTVLPLSVGPQTLYLGEGVTLQGQPFGPAWQLGLWSLRA